MVRLDSPQRPDNVSGLFRSHRPQGEDRGRQKRPVTPGNDRTQKLGHRGLLGVILVLLGIVMWKEIEAERLHAALFDARLASDRLERRMLRGMEALESKHFGECKIIRS